QPERQYKLRADVLVARMKERGFSIAALADKLDVDASTVRRWRKGGKAYMRNIVALSKALDLPHYNLIEGFEPEDRIQIKISLYLPPASWMNPTDQHWNFLKALENLIGATDGITQVSSELLR